MTVVTGPWRWRVVRVPVRLMAVVLSGVVAATAAAAPAQAHSPVSPERALAAVQAAAPMAHVSTGSDRDSALVLRNGRSTVDVPRTETGYTTLATESGTLAIGLPHARRNNKGRPGNGNGIAYPGTRGLTNVVRVTPQAQVQTWAVLPGRDSPTSVTYRVKGARSLTVDGNGGLVAFNSAGMPFAFAPRPVVRDAAGRSISARFTTDGGSSVTVHAAHRRAGTRYPVAVDPLWGAVALRAIIAAASGCASNAAPSLIESAYEHHIRPGSQRWKELLWEAADDCVWGALTGVAGRFVPGWLKKYVAKAIRGGIYNQLRRQAG